MKTALIKNACVVSLLYRRLVLTINGKTKLIIYAKQNESCESKLYIHALYTEVRITSLRDKEKGELWTKHTLKRFPCCAGCRYYEGLNKNKTKEARNPDNDTIGTNLLHCW